MTREEAKRYACRKLAEVIACDLEAPDGWTHVGPDGEFSDADRERVQAACEELIDEFIRRGGGDQKGAKGS